MIRVGLLLVTFAVIAGVKELHLWGPPAATLSPALIAPIVGGYYGDSHPHLVRVEADSSDGPSLEPMYHMTLQGHFHRGARKAQYLDFSALADKPYVWDIIAGSDPRHRVWFDRELRWGSL